jgi:hypothetical protein
LAKVCFDPEQNKKEKKVSIFVCLSWKSYFLIREFFCLEKPSAGAVSGLK